MPSSRRSDAVTEPAAALTAQGLTRVEVARRTGMSRSTVQRIRDDRREVPVASDRKQAGIEPLPPGHPLSWLAISQQAFELGTG